MTRLGPLWPASVRHSPADDNTAPISGVVVVLPQLPVTPT